MKPPVLGTIKGNAWIYQNGNYVVITGKKLTIFRPDGMFLASRPDIRNITKVTFAPNDCMLVDANRFYYLISLKDGVELWRIPRGKRDTFSGQFALTPDGLFAYDYFKYAGELYLVKIDLQTGESSTVYICPGLRTTVDILCDENGTPCLLQEHYSDISGKQFSENGILYQYQESYKLGSPYYWKAKWMFEGKQCSAFFLNDTDTILTNDLYIYKPGTEEMYYLLENERNWKPPESYPIVCSFESKRSLVVLSYEMCNVIIDARKKQLVACYSGKYTRGCLIDDLFWISSEKGIIQKPFPLIEDVPPKQHVPFF